MSITLTPFMQSDLCHGASWTVADKDVLADHIARVAVGQSRHVARILAGADLGPPPTQASSLLAAIKMLTVVGPDPSHRDGWMFQVMSWIAANNATPGGLIRPPHMILANKGYDGLQLEINHATGSLVAATIFEDKATVNPRDTIHDDVWPEFKRFENGENDNVLTAEVIALLGTRNGIDPDAAIEDVIWKKNVKYRISITIEEGHDSNEGRNRLFKGYKDVAPGMVARRRGETFVVQYLRPWMAQLANKAISAVKALEMPHV